MTHIVLTPSPKGGVGKSTVVTQLMYMLGIDRVQTLVVDTDIQASVAERLDEFYRFSPLTELVETVYGQWDEEGYDDWEANKQVLASSGTFRAPEFSCSLLSELSGFVWDYAEDGPYKIVHTYIDAAEPGEDLDFFSSYFTFMPIEALRSDPERYQRTLEGHLAQIGAEVALVDYRPAVIQDVVNSSLLLRERATDYTIVLPTRTDEEEVNLACRRLKLLGQELELGGVPKEKIKPVLVINRSEYFFSSYEEANKVIREFGERIHRATEENLSLEGICDELISKQKKERLTNEAWKFFYEGYGLKEEDFSTLMGAIEKLGERRETLQRHYRKLELDEYEKVELRRYEGIFVLDNKKYTPKMMEREEQIQNKEKLYGKINQRRDDLIKRYGDAINYLVTLSRTKSPLKEPEVSNSFAERDNPEDLKHGWQIEAGREVDRSEIMRIAKRHLGDDAKVIYLPTVEVTSHLYVQERYFPGVHPVITRLKRRIAEYDSLTTYEEINKAYTLYNYLASGYIGEMVGGDGQSYEFYRSMTELKDHILEQ